MAENWVWDTDPDMCPYTRSEIAEIDLSPSKKEAIRVAQRRADRGKDDYLRVYAERIGARGTSSSKLIYRKASFRLRK